MWINDQIRLLLLIIVCSVLWSLESLIPLYRERRNRLRRAFPNIILAVVLIITNLVLSFSSAWLASYALQHHIGLLFWFHASSWPAMIFAVMGLDLFAYLAHMLLHKSWLGWQFHRVHHSEQEVDVTTAFRQHPGETVWRIFWQLAAIIVFGIPLWIVAIYLTLSSLNAQLEHANIKMNLRLDWLLRLLIVTPDMHKAHHSRRHQETDSNYSNIFSIWDRLFGTYTRKINFHELRYGLDGFDGDDKQTLAALLKMPFVTY